MTILRITHQRREKIDGSFENVRTKDRTTVQLFRDTCQHSDSTAFAWSLGEICTNKVLFFIGTKEHLAAGYFPPSPTQFVSVQRCQKVLRALMLVSLPMIYWPLKTKLSFQFCGECCLFSIILLHSVGHYGRSHHSNPGDSSESWIRLELA